MLNFQNCPIEGRLEKPEILQALGVRTMQLTYNERNDIGDGPTERTDAGISTFGLSVIERMNELGTVDSSHSGHQTSFDAIEFSKKPSIFFTPTARRSTSILAIRPMSIFESWRRKAA